MLTFLMCRRAVLAGIASVVLALTIGLSPADAQTLEAAKERGKLLVGIQGDNVPLGFLDSQGKNDGYDADMARMFGKKLGLPVEFVIVTNQNRIAALQSGKVDVLFSSLAMNAERAKVLQYSQPYIANQVSVLAAKDKPYKTFSDLKGVAIGVPKGSSQDIQLTKLAPDADIKRFDDDSATVQALLSGQVDAVGANQFYLARVEKQAPGAYEYKIPIVATYNGAGCRLGDKEMNKALNDFIDEAKSSGKIAELYKKWINAEAPEFPTKIEGVPYSTQ
ncbi:transporter substrate-binding domain-containing protein [Mesorhizobium australafricanum]|uniref:Transporter substrate-binding domain-containing protein n=1 Tax=Mesorhizobium australafricanum TaxID=3072311 RepID=A0ABU4WZI5_9HYPH|nr:transporter substrate-binding domain-containing protein [Mesorhizobium sp. VK3E]MDX8440229.1 transporter substrate-binding domain-containing protein [Mesorhizobium sp. VK3E]